jgi:hypothetical protein
MRTAKGRIVSMRIPSRRTFWLSAAALLVGIVICGSFFVPSHRVSRENFDRIQNGMGLSQVQQILGEPDGGMWAAGGFQPSVLGVPPAGVTTSFQTLEWNDGPNSITVYLNGNDLSGKEGVTCKEIHLATAWETVTWYAKKGAEKIGIK